MKLDLHVNGAPARITAEAHGEEWLFSYAPEGAGPFESAASAIEVEPGLYSVLCQGRSYLVRATLSAGAVEVDAGGHRFAIEVTDPREASAPAAGARAGGRHQVISPMPGKVVRVLVGEGDEVVAGAGLVVVEAMKMQNELTSPAGGRVVSVKATENASVAAGEVLVIVEAGGG